MRNRKNTTKQERFNLVTQFIASGQSQVSWCKEQGIATSTFSKWVKEYKNTSEEIKFVPLSPKKTTIIPPVTESITIKNTILIEIGSCKSNGLKAMHYLQYVFEQIQSKQDLHISDILPWSENIPKDVKI